MASYDVSKIRKNLMERHNIGKSLILPALSVINSSATKQNTTEMTSIVLLSNSSLLWNVWGCRKVTSNEIVRKEMCLSILWIFPKL